MSSIRPAAVAPVVKPVGSRLMKVGAKMANALISASRIGPAARDTNATRPRGTAPRRGAVLLIEDCDPVRQGLAQLLELHGFFVADARDAEHALEQLANEPDGFALIVLDLVLQGMLSGRDFRLRQLADPALARVPTIVITAAAPGWGARALLRPDAWLEKPFGCDALLHLVKRYVISEGSALQAYS